MRIETHRRPRREVKAGRLEQHGVGAEYVSRQRIVHDLAAPRDQSTRTKDPARLDQIELGAAFMFLDDRTTGGNLDAIARKSPDITQQYFSDGAEARHFAAQQVCRFLQCGDPYGSWWTGPSIDRPAARRGGLASMTFERRLTRRSETLNACAGVRIMRVS